MHVEIGRRGELLRVLEVTLEDLIKERDKSHKYAVAWQNRAKAVEKERNETREEKKREVGALQARLVEKEKETEALRRLRRRRRRWMIPR